MCRGPDLRARAVEELCQLDADVEQSWRQFGRSISPRRRPETELRELRERELEAKELRNDASPRLVEKRSQRDVFITPERSLVQLRRTLDFESLSVRISLLQSARVNFRGRIRTPSERDPEWSVASNSNGSWRKQCKNACLNASTLPL